MARVGKKRRAPKVLAGAILVAIVMLAASSAAAAVATRHACHAPRLTGLTLEVARARAAHAHCMLRLKGAPLERAAIQTVARQSPRAGRRFASVTVWMNPLCFGSADYGPVTKEPRLTAGPTELISGFYLDGGPAAPYSSASCMRPEPKPESGIVEVIDSSGNVVATETSAQGHFVEIPLPAGSYMIRGTFLRAAINEVHPVETKSLVIPAGYSVRQDFSLDLLAAHQCRSGAAGGCCLPPSPGAWIDTPRPRDRPAANGLTTPEERRDLRRTAGEAAHRDGPRARRGPADPSGLLASAALAGEAPVMPGRATPRRHAAQRQR